MHEHGAVLAATGPASCHAEKEYLERPYERIGNLRRWLVVSGYLSSGNDSDQRWEGAEELATADVVVPRRKELREAGRQNVDHVDQERCLGRCRVLKVCMVRERLPESEEARVRGA